MSSKKLFTVIGATGGQGGGIIKTFLSDPKLKSEWSLRGITRDVNKESSKKLASQGVEVVSADLNDKASLIKAFQGSYAVFAVTNYWEKMDASLELQQGKNLAEAAKETGVQHYIWSTLYNIKERSNGALPNVYHFDSKAKAADYVRELGVPATFFMPGFYMDNLPGKMFGPRPPNGHFILGLPIKGDSPIPFYTPSDTGKYIKAIVNNREKLLGKNFLGANEYTTPDKIVEDFKRVFPEAGATASHQQVPDEPYKAGMKQAMGGAPDFVVQEMYENMLLLQDFGYYFGEPLDETLALVEDPLTTWTEFIKVAPAWNDLK